MASVFRAAGQQSPRLSTYLDPALPGSNAAPEGNMAEMKSDIEIARGARKKQIQEIGQKIGIPSEHLLPYG
ncbi:hypothetical protein NKH81_31620, partial [Mesorhizobium sp. M0959]|uniref:hypothetical protein n=1 Tax=Mesorhizobium sp. M0959 TaxID=2957034 RepID=UPI00333690DB